VAAPYPDMQFMPTGGINADNIGTYLSYEKILVCGGSWMAEPSLINAGRFDEITRRCRDALQKAHGFSMTHIGINAAHEDEARKSAAFLERFFGFPPKDGNSSIFAGDGIELLKSPYLGRNGHIAIAVNNVWRAKAYLERNGLGFNNESAKLDGKGALASIYLSDELAGFALHLVQKK
jgi:2-dehydro-3-deoxyphosphogluconate aldolase/(4S)-4-hydroxy-2-oxoglutarate aldolase